MKFLRKIFIILIVISVSITSVSCVDTSELGKSIDELEKPFSEAEETIKETTEEETTEEKPSKKKSEEELIEELALSVAELKEDIREVIVDDFGGTLTKFVFDRDNGTFYLAYNSMWSSEGRIKKEIFDIVSFLALAGCGLDLDVVATNDSGENYHSYTKTDILIKIKNYEISYEEWLEEAF
ncbi:hypothetical protein ES703_43066 [subsurface metagenome]